MILWTINVLLWRKGDVYEKMWRIDAGVRSAVKIWDRRILEGSL